MLSEMPEQFEISAEVEVIVEVEAAELDLHEDMSFCYLNPR